MPISAFAPKSDHTFYYIEPRIQPDKLWDIP